MTLLSPYLLAVIAGWVVAQGLKYLIIAARRRSFDHIRQLYLSGNMPSAHSATSVALCVVVGLINGFDSAIFAVVALLASIVMYDAMMVRRSVGEQGAAVQQLIRETKSTQQLPRAARGHTPMEVLAGAVLGVLIGVVVFLATR
jgi:uncharacterized protein